MWIFTRSDWPVLVNLSVAATIEYQQVAKFDTRVRVIATSWEAEHLVADCATGDEAKAIIRHLAQGLRQGTEFIDLNQVDLSKLADSRGNVEHGVL